MSDRIRRAARASIVLTAYGVLAGCASQQGAAPGQPQLATKPTVGQEMGALAENQVQVTFPQGGYRLSPEADRQLDLAVRLFRDANPVVMFTMGYTDRSGDELSNIALSARRARAVKQALVARGIPADRLLIQAFGGSELANAADPLAPENRRVLIKWRLI